LWFGTMTNTHCLVLGAFLRSYLGPHEVPAWVCEYQASQLAKPPYNLPAAVADWRPPRLYMYSLATQTLIPRIPGDPAGIQRLGTTTGIRSAGTLGDVVFLGGPSLKGGVNLFAFRADTGSYLGSHSFPQYDNIRRWIVVDGVLYTAVGRVDGGGSVLRWTGSAEAPFQFEVVGNVDSDAAELAAHQGRLFVGTWPDFLGGGGGTAAVLAGLWMSPPVPPGGLTAAEADGWTKIWQVDDYEPDPVTAATYGMGAMASFDGHLYWGVMHVPFVATYAHFLVHDPPGENALQEAIQGTWRAISIFRGIGLGGASWSVQLLYGERLLPVYIPSLTQGRPGTWLPLPNNMGLLGGIPLYGSSGFGNPYNNYTWIMSVFNGQLHVGTMDWSYLIDQISFDIGPLPPRQHGADHYRFVSSRYGAVPESLGGAGNPANYGIRTALSDDALYLGMANPMNLLTDPAAPLGGWELIKLTVQEGVFPPEGPRGTRISLSGSPAGPPGGIRFGVRGGKVWVGSKKAKILAWGDTGIHCQVPERLKPGSYPVKIKPKGDALIVLDQRFAVTAP
jgi:hypothetical protein